jgi:hypothetical protein
MFWWHGHILSAVMADDDKSCLPPHDMITSETFTPLAYIIYKNLKYIVVMMMQRVQLQATPLSHHSTCAAEQSSLLVLIVDTSRYSSDSEVWNARKWARHDVARSITQLGLRSSLFGCRRTLSLPGDYYKIRFRRSRDILMCLILCRFHIDCPPQSFRCSLWFRWKLDDFPWV